MLIRRRRCDTQHDTGGRPPPVMPAGIGVTTRGGGCLVWVPDLGRGQARAITLDTDDVTATATATATAIYDIYRFPPRGGITLLCSALLCSGSTVYIHSLAAVIRYTRLERVYNETDKLINYYSYRSRIDKGRAREGKTD